MSAYRDCRTVSLGDSDIKDAGMLLIKVAGVNRRKSQNNDVSDYLREAIRQGRIDWCRQLLARGVSVDDMDCAGRTLLHEASSSGHLDIVKLLLDTGATRLINARAIGGDTACHLAARCGFGPVVKTLVEAGADMEMKSSRGRDVRQEAIAFDHQRTAALVDSLFDNHNT
ncbi:osteoclast-stimulating factor 1-like [Corticium candelabrum]|uniref:osteoclast-stimulating factor 1-like n=1 Tax=Corticium candelabrum TaxID=121492 RepID=UPI002E3593C9|nr:osteoclast-stimulating factor 1-like [Corticium candelabrum]